MKQYAAILCKRINGLYLDTNIQIEILKPIIGTIEKGILKTDDGFSFKCIDEYGLDCDDEEFYMLPIEVEELLTFKEKEFRDIDLNTGLITYLSDVNDNNHYYLEYKVGHHNYTCYMNAQENQTTYEIDPRKSYNDISFEMEEETKEETKEEIEEETEEIFEQKVKDINFKELFSKITSTVIAQDEQIKKILVALKNHYSSDKFKANILLAGMTGTGKTELVKTLSKNLNIPYVIVDSTKFTQEGYVGRSVDEAIIELCQKTNDVKKASQGILVFDEIDKKAIRGNEVVATKAVLDSLLKFMEKGIINVRNIGSFDTSKLVFIASGAFSGITFKDKEVGFNKELSNDSNFSEIENKDFVNYGFTEEFMGRINHLIILNELSVNDLANILIRSDKSVLEAHKKLLKETYNINLKYEDIFIEEIAKAAHGLNMGARGLESVVNSCLYKVYEELLFGDRTYNELILDNSKTYRLK